MKLWNLLLDKGRSVSDCPPVSHRIQIAEKVGVKAGSHHRINLFSVSDHRDQSGMYHIVYPYGDFQTPSQPRFEPPYSKTASVQNTVGISLKFYTRGSALDGCADVQYNTILR